MLRIATLLHEPQSATNLSSVLCRLRGCCVVFAHCQEEKFGVTVAAIQMSSKRCWSGLKSMKRWAAGQCELNTPKISQANCIPGAESCSRIALTESQTQRFRLCFKNTVDHFVSAERIQRRYREDIETYYAWWPFPTFSMLVKLEARKQLATVGWADFEQRGLQVKI